MPEQGLRSSEAACVVEGLLRLGHHGHHADKAPQGIGDSRRALGAPGEPFIPSHCTHGPLSLFPPLLGLA